MNRRRLRRWRVDVGRFHRRWRFRQWLRLPWRQWFAGRRLRWFPIRVLRGVLLWWRVLSANVAPFCLRRRISRPLTTRHRQLLRVHFRRGWAVEPPSDSERGINRANSERANVIAVPLLCSRSRVQDGCDGETQWPAFAAMVPNGAAFVLRAVRSVGHSPYNLALSATGWPQDIFWLELDIQSGSNRSCRRRWPIRGAPCDSRGTRPRGTKHAVHACKQKGA